MLKELSGQTHMVVTSLCGINTRTNRAALLSTTSYVRFKELSEVKRKRVKQIGDGLVSRRVKNIYRCLQWKELGWTDEMVKNLLGEHDYELFKLLEESKQSA